LLDANGTTFHVPIPVGVFDKYSAEVFCNISQKLPTSIRQLMVGSVTPGDGTALVARLRAHNDNICEDVHTVLLAAINDLACRHQPVSCCQVRTAVVV
jgi:hypothetical protein